jgi:hypothetical protein
LFDNKLGSVAELGGERDCISDAWILLDITSGTEDVVVSNSWFAMVILMVELLSLLLIVIFSFIMLSKE